MADPHPIHAYTIDTLSIIIEDMKRKMIHHIAHKLDLSEEEMKEKYCNDPVELRVCNTIQVQGIAIQEGPVFMDPPKHPVSKKKQSRSTRKPSEPKPTIEELQNKLEEGVIERVNTAIDSIRTETTKLVSEVGERMIAGETLDRKETRILLKPLNEVLNDIESSGLITKKQRMNRVNRNITNILHGADPTKDKRLRKIAREDPTKFFEIVLDRVKCVIIQNLSKE
jgi:hypothetical protein